MTDQILLPAVDAAATRLARALAHADRMGGMDHSDTTSSLVAEMTYGLDEATRQGGDLGIDPGVVEWIMVAGTPADTAARMAVWLAEVAADVDEHDHYREGTGEPVAPGSMVARAALLLALHVGVMAHRDGAG